MEQTCKRNSYQSISLYLFLKINLVMLFLIAIFIHFICSSSFIIIFNVSSLCDVRKDVANQVII